jgi:hypothetical protein
LLLEGDWLFASACRESGGVDLGRSALESPGDGRPIRSRNRFAAGFDRNFLDGRSRRLSPGNTRGSGALRPRDAISHRNLRGAPGLGTRSPPDRSGRRSRAGTGCTRETFSAILLILGVVRRGPADLNLEVGPPVAMEDATALARNAFLPADYAYARRSANCVDAGPAFLAGGVRSGWSSARKPGSSPIRT